MFTEIFEKLLETRTITPYKLAQATGISNGLISGWRKGNVLPSAENLIKLSDFFNVTIDYLLGRDQKIVNNNVKTLELKDNDEMNQYSMHDDITESPTLGKYLAFLRHNLTLELAAVNMNISADILDAIEHGIYATEYNKRYCFSTEMPFPQITSTLLKNILNAYKQIGIDSDYLKAAILAENAKCISFSAFDYREQANILKYIMTTSVQLKTTVHDILYPLIGRGIDAKAPDFTANEIQIISENLKTSYSEMLSGKTDANTQTASKEARIFKTCFVASPIGEDNSDMRRRSNQLFNEIIIPACSKHGVTPIRSDQKFDNDKINDTILNELLRSDLVIADLTDNNPNVFFEVGYRQALEKEIIHIYLANADYKLPFDVYNIRAIPYSLSSKLEKESTISILEKTIATIKKRHENPDQSFTQIESTKIEGVS